MLLDTLRDGQDSQIMMVNYRKSGEVFENLLTMAYVRDSLGRRRYCIGLQLDLTGLESDDGPWGREALNSDSGKEMIETARKKMAMLIKMLPQTLPVPPPVERISNRDAPSVHGAEWTCPQLDVLVAVLGQQMPSTAGRNWLSVLYAILDECPHAAIAVDMNVPGLPLDYANGAFTALTGYPINEAIGRNCRFLQDERTEPVQLATLITAIRTYAPCHLQITNVRKGGDAFVNDLSMHPLIDSAGVCRAIVALSGDATSGATDASLQAMRQAMPGGQPIDASLLPEVVSPFGPIDPIAQWREFQATNCKLMRLLWATDPDGTLRQFLNMPSPMKEQAIGSIGQFLKKTGRDEDLALYSRIIELHMSGSWSALAGRKVMGAAPQQQHNKQPIAPAAPSASTQRPQPAPAPPPPPASQQVVAHVGAAPSPAKPLSMASADEAVKGVMAEVRPMRCCLRTTL